ncbi:MAG TPA: hypothetical protein PKU91_06000, partial [Phycisphaerales bacterium]|nr:hypothetical protein [Phycisphaerales bacterium]
WLSQDPSPWRGVFAFVPGAMGGRRYALAGREGIVVTPWQVGCLVSGIVVFEGILLALVLRSMCSSTFGVLARRHPAGPVSPDAARRDFQSISFGMSNFGLCVHLAADDSGLHLRPAMILRWCGARDVTVPWTHVAILPHTRSRRWISCRISGLRARIPAWCIEAVG